MAKAKKDTFENSNVIYEFLCPCEEFYICQTGRTLETRADEHFKNDCSNICTHKQNCKIYKNDAKKFLKENKKFIPDPLEARYEHFKKKFKIIGKGFKTDHDRERTEAFRIRTNMPKINKQTDQYAFRLF